MREEYLVTLLNEYGDEIVLLLPSRQDLAYIPRKYSIEEEVFIIPLSSTFKRAALVLAPPISKPMIKKWF